MSPLLYAHPFSSYCWKVLIALYENETPFELRIVEDDVSRAELAALWPINKMPVLVDGACTLIESSIIIEYLAMYHSGPVELIPSDPDAALHARCLDRVFDNYVMAPMQAIVSDFIRPEAERDPRTVADAKLQLDQAYRWLDKTLPDAGWAMPDGFTLADCAAAPALFYADWVHPIPTDCARTRAYRTRLLAHPSVARVVNEARPYRGYFPPGAPDRD